MRLHLLTTLLPLLPLATSQSFYSFSIYTDSRCSVLAGAIDGSTSQNCTSILRTTTTTTPSYNTSAPTIFMQSDGFMGACQINLYSDKYCVDEVSSTTSPPNLGCVSSNGGLYYEVLGC